MEREKKIQKLWAYTNSKTELREICIPFLLTLESFSEVKHLTLIVEEKQIMKIV